MKRVLITGANGFLGKEVTKMLVKRHFQVRCAFRKSNLPEFGNLLYESCLVGNIDETTKWNQALQNVDTVIHLAARVHVMKETEMDPLSGFRKINVDGTKKLAMESASSGVCRFVFISSVKVNGEKTMGDPFSEKDTPKPCDPYGISKWEAEQALQKIAKNMAMDVVVIRPPLIYGPGVRGNFLRLLKLVDKGFPLPLKKVKNSRSLAHVRNVADLIVLCGEHPNASGQSFFVSDGEDLSTGELIDRLSHIMGRKSRLFPFPGRLISLLGNISGKANEVQRLFGSLKIDISKAKELLDWNPPVSVDEGLTQTVDWFINSQL